MAREREPMEVLRDELNNLYDIREDLTGRLYNSDKMEESIYFVEQLAEVQDRIDSAEEIFRLYLRKE